MLLIFLRVQMKTKTIAVLYKAYNAGLPCIVCVGQD